METLSSLVIRPAEAEDFPRWQLLWDAYNAFYGREGVTALPIQDSRERFAVSTRWGASLGLDAVDLALRNLSANPAAARSVPALQRRLAQARQTIDR